MLSCKKRNRFIVSVIAHTFGIEHDQVYVVHCECGTHEMACGYCLEAGRVTECLKCGQDLGQYFVRKCSQIHSDIAKKLSDRILDLRNRDQ